MRFTKQPATIMRASLRVDPLLMELEDCRARTAPDGAAPARQHWFARRPTRRAMRDASAQPLDLYARTRKAITKGARVSRDASACPKRPRTRIDTYAQPQSR
ncbi:hypothetical protein HpMS107_34290 [Helicobacter pylori]